MVLDVVDSALHLRGSGLVVRGLPKLRVLQGQTLDALDDHEVGLTGLLLVKAVNKMLRVDHIVLGLVLDEVLHPGVGSRAALSVTCLGLEWQVLLVEKGKMLVLVDRGDMLARDTWY